MEHKVTLQDRFFCNGYDPIWGKKFPCWIANAATGPREHGWESVVDGLKNSCNVVMAELGRRVGADNLAKYSRFFGLGRPTGLNLYPTESYGLVPDPEWKAQNKKGTWYPIETCQFAIGQTYLTVTPLQLAEVYAAIATNGKIYKPRLVTAITDPSGNVVTSFKSQLIADLRMPALAKDIIQQGLQEVVDIGGTASAAFIGFPLKEIPVAGKTGTAQKPPYDDNGVFACYAPTDKPEIVVIVLVEQGGSGSAGAAPVGRKVLEAYFEDRIKKIMAANQISTPSTLKSIKVENQATMDTNTSGVNSPNNTPAPPVQNPGNEQPVSPAANG